MAKKFIYVKFVPSLLILALMILTVFFAPYSAWITAEATPALRTNLLKNGDFETVNNLWSGNIVADPVDPDNMCLTVTGTTRYDDEFTEPLKESTIYKVTFRYMTDSNNAGQRLFWKAWDGGAALPAATFISGIKGDNTWRTISFYYKTASSFTTFSDAYFIFGIDGAGTAYVDDAELTEYIPGDNLITNGDFEHDITSWSIPAASIVNSDEGSDGYYSVVSAENYYRRSLPLFLKPNTTYRLSYDYKTSDGRIRFYFANVFPGNNFYSDRSDLTWSNQTREFTTSGTIPLDTGWNFCIMMESGTPALIDNIKIAEVVPKEMTGIAITAPPAKMEYVIGQTFNPAGMAVTASYDDGSTEPLSSGYTITPSGKFNTAGSTAVTVTYDANPAWTDTITVNVSANLIQNGDFEGTGNWSGDNIVTDSSNKCLEVSSEVDYTGELVTLLKSNTVYKLTYSYKTSGENIQFRAFFYYPTGNLTQGNDKNFYTGCRNDKWVTVNYLFKTSDPITATSVVFGFIRDGGGIGGWVDDISLIEYAPGDNLITNGDFEHKVNSSFLVGWKSEINTGIRYDQDRDGNVCELTALNSNNYNAPFAELMKPGAKYKVSYDYKLTGDAKVQIYIKTSVLPGVTSFYSPGRVDDEWSSHSFAFTFDPNSPPDRNEIYFAKNGEGTALIDNVKIVEISEWDILSSLEACLLKTTGGILSEAELKALLDVEVIDIIALLEYKNSIL